MNKKACNMNTKSEFGESFKPVCHGSTRPLLDLVSTQIALKIWIEKFNEVYSPGNNSYIEINEFNFNSEGLAVVPVKIRKIIDTRMFPIAYELIKWVEYVKNVSKKLSYDQIYARFNLVVFGANGTVCFKDTIANFLEDESLNNMTRFEIACVNCVEEKIDVYWPLVSDNLNVDNLQFDHDFMLYYWICRKRGELDRIPLGEFNSIEQLMIEKCDENFNYLAFEYFFTSLNPNDQLVELGELENRDHRRRFKYRNENFTRLFPNIDGLVQRHILDKYAADVLYAFVTCLRPIEYVVQCFLYIRNIITPESYCHNIIIRHINCVVDIGNPMIRINEDVTNVTREPSKTEEHFLYEQTAIALEQIWLNTPPHLKKYALENLTTILDEFHKFGVCCLLVYGRDIRFLLALLSDANSQLRNNVWIKYWPYWINDVPPSQFKELMELCLMKTESIEEFKSTLPYTEQFLHNCDFFLICEGYFSVLDDFLNSLYSNSELVFNIKKHILNNATEIFSRLPEAMEKYSKYIDNLFSNSLLAAEFKDNMIFSDPIINVLLQKEITCHFDFIGVEFIISLFVSPQKHADIKLKFLELFRDEITNGQLCYFNEHRWSEFLMWCTDSKEHLEDDFRKSLQIDVVFEATFLCSLKNVRHYPENAKCASLNTFLIWYFKSKQMSENYIRERIEYYEFMDAAEVERIFGRNQQNVIDEIIKKLLYNYISIDE